LVWLCFPLAVFTNTISILRSQSVLHITEVNGLRYWGHCYCYSYVCFHRLFEVHYPFP
jgi:hypothetical protein